jgi:hypothetical protein
MEISVDIVIWSSEKLVKKASGQLTGWHLHAFIALPFFKHVT